VGRDSRARILPAEFVGDSVFSFPAAWPLFKGVFLLHLLVRGWVCVISFPNVSAISQHDLDPGLKLANSGIIEKVEPLWD
jgi:hypothetical protein